MSADYNFVGATDGQSGAARVAALFLAAVWVGCALWATDGQMRESDQASLLSGAVELARGTTTWVGNDSYNFDKQYLAYWVVAGALKVCGGEGATIEKAVQVSNYTAVLLFALALLTSVVTRRDWSWLDVILLGCVLLCPVVAFSGMFLSPNLISGAFLLFLVSVLGRDGKGLGCLGLVFFLSFAAVGARQDAVLAMPLLALLALRSSRWREILKNPLLWTLLGGSLIAIGVGRLIDPVPTQLPAPFFVPSTFVVYLMGGLGGALVLLIFFAGQALWRRSWEGVLLGAAALVPLVFYGCLLYTPRHLFVVSLVLFATVLLPQGGVQWSRLVSTRFGKLVLGFCVAATIVPWLVGVRMSDWTKGVLTLGGGTLYPTADGFWPMGGYGEFYGRLANAVDDPVDHNQEVWASWTSLNGDELPSGRGAVISSGLTSYGEFSLIWHGREIAKNTDSADFVLFDDRTLAKRQLGVNQLNLSGRESVIALFRSGQIREVGRAAGRSVLLWTTETSEEGVGEGVKLRMSLAEGYGGNDFRLAPWKETEWKERDLSGFRVVLAARSEEAVRAMGGSSAVVELRSDYDSGPWFVSVLDGEEIGRLKVKAGGEIWIACGMLPEFMDIRGYGK